MQVKVDPINTNYINVTNKYQVLSKFVINNNIIEDNFITIY